MTKQKLIDTTNEGIEVWKKVTELQHGNRKDKTKTTKYTIKSNVETSNLGNIRFYRARKGWVYGKDVYSTKLTRHLRTKLAVLEDKEFRPCFMRHQIVLQTFFPEDIPNIILIDHMDRDPTNNKLTNLRWTTFKTNANNRTQGLPLAVVERLKYLEKENAELKEKLESFRKLLF